MKKLLLPLLIASSAAQSADLFFNTEKPEPDFYDEAIFHHYDEKCADHGQINIAVSYLRSNRTSINQAVNADIPDAAAVKAFARENMENIVDYFKDDELEPSASICTLELTYTPRYYGHYKTLEQIAVDYFEYTGGAHGLYSTAWYVFDNNDQRLTLDTLLEQNGKDALYRLLEKAYSAETGSDGKDAGGTDGEWYKAVRTDAGNFYFDSEGLVMSYAPYSIGSYAQGQIELRLPYAELTGVVKAAYLP